MHTCTRKHAHTPTHSTRRMQLVPGWIEGQPSCMREVLSGRLYVCVDMCMDMYVVMFIDMCVAMCVGTFIDMCVDMCIDMCVDMCVDLCMACV